LVYTGQHYDYEMSKTFFEEFKIKEPNYWLDCKGEQVGKMVDSLIKIYKKEKPTCVIVYGDTNSTVAGALAAYQCRIPIVHIESGFRCGDKMMLEENNRIVTDHLSFVNFCATQEAAENLKKEGITQNVFVVGDIHYQRYLEHRKNKKKYTLLTLHRPENVEDKDRLQKLVNIAHAYKHATVFPCHPRTLKNIKKWGIVIPDNFKLIKPVNYGKMLQLIGGANLVVTDSGGVIRESWYAGAPVVIARDTHEFKQIEACFDGETEKKIINIVNKIFK